MQNFRICSAPRIRNLINRVSLRGDGMAMLSSAAILALIAGCATTETVQPVRQPRHFTTTVSSSSGLFVPTKNETIRWDGSITITDTAHRLTADREQQITTALKNEFQQRGINFTTESTARFAMTAAIVVGNDVGNAQLNRLCGVAPELQPRDGVELAAMGVCISEPDTQQVVWKSATEIVIRSSDSETAQIERIQRTVRDMLSSLPAAR